MAAAPQHDPAAVDTSGRPLGPRALRTRARLLEAGRATMAANGLHATRVDDIVAAARSSHGTFYLYFASKEALFDELVAEVAADLAPLVAELPRITDSVRGRRALRAWLGLFVDAYARHHDVIRIWTEGELSGDELGSRGDDVLSGLVLALTQNVRFPKRAGVDSAIASLALVSMVERLNYYVVAYALPYDRDEVVETCAAVIEAVAFT